MWWLVFTALFQLYNQCVRTEFSGQFFLLPLISQEKKKKKRGPPFGKFPRFWSVLATRVRVKGWVYNARTFISLTKKRFLG